MNVPATFKIVFLVVVAFTFLSFIGQGAMAFFGDAARTEADLSIFQRNFYSACSFGWQAGLGAILGLIGGKVTE
ncbi:MAG: hypothetical protein Q8K18_15100 [Burkholderiales bacterium]|nr:hypothetical protein [Burkholderiales bacterium]